MEIHCKMLTFFVGKSNPGIILKEKNLLGYNYILPPLL